MATAPHARQFHPMPVIGHPETWYKKHIEIADAAGDALAHCSYKVGQYVTLGMDPQKSWEEKAKYFRHCIKHHCVAPPGADAETIAFCNKLRDIVCRYASQEARRLAHAEHEQYAMRLDMGASRETLADEADVFFPALLGHGPCPEYITPEAFKDICGLRDRWI